MWIIFCFQCTFHSAYNGIFRYYAEGGKRKFLREDVEVIGDKNEFRRELKELLEKHNATISWCCDSFSDLANVYDNRIELSINEHDEIVVYGDSIESSDL